MAVVAEFSAHGSYDYVEIITLDVVFLLSHKCHEISATLHISIIYNEGSRMQRIAKQNFQSEKSPFSPQNPICLSILVFLIPFLSL